MTSTSPSTFSLGGLAFAVNPCLTKRDDVQAWLASFPDNTASVFETDDGARQILIKRETGFEVMSLEGVTEQTLISGVSLDATNDMLLEHLPLFPSTSSFRNFTVQTVAPGEVIHHARPTAAAWQVCAFTNKGAPGGSSEYFDLTAHPWTGDSRAPLPASRRCLTYSSGAVAGATHTRDLHATHASPGQRSTNRLMHGMTFPSTPGTWFVTGATGFNSTRLRTMGPQMPSIVIVDYERETLFLLPFSIQEAVVGNATSSFAAATEYDAAKGCFVTYTLSGQLNVEGTNTGDTRNPTMEAIRLAVAEAEATKARVATEAMVPAVALPTLVEESKAPEPAAVCDDAEVTKVVDWGPLVVGVQESLLWDGRPDPSAALGACGTEMTRFTFLRGPTFGPPGTAVAPVDASAAPVTLPNIFGTCQGGSDAAALMLAQPAKGVPPSMGAYQAGFEGRLPIVFVEAYGWSRQVAATRQTVVNGILILKVPDMIDFSNRTAREAVMTALPRDAFILGGPMSMALVEFPGGKRAWYRGVPWPGLDLWPTIRFGGDVSAQLSDERLAAFCQSNLPLPWPVLTDANDPRVWVAGEGMVDYREVIDRCRATASGADVEALQTLLVSTLDQVAIMLQPDALKELRSTLVTALNDAVTAIQAPIVAKLREVAARFGALEEGADPATISAIKKEIAALTGQRREVKRSFQKLTDALQAMVSQRASSSRKADLARMARQEAIASNVTAATTMTPEALRKFLEEIDEFVMVTLPSPAALTPLLEATSSSTLCATLMATPAAAPGAPRLADVKSNFVSADGVTVSVLAEISDGDRGHTLALPAGPSVALPLSTTMRHLSMVPIPILTRYVDMDHPGVFNWVEEANHPVVAKYRILLRSMFSQGNASRTVAIPPASKELTFLVIHFFLEVMQSLVDRMSTVPDRADAESFGSTSARILRGLTGLVLTTMGSGASPASSLWQMVMGKPNLAVPPANQMWILRALMRVLPYTGWDMTAFRANLADLATRTIRKCVTGPPIEALACKSKVAATMTGAEAHRRRAVLSAWHGVCAGVLMVWDEVDPSTYQEVAQQVVEMAPSNLGELDDGFRHQSSDIMRAFFIPVSSGSSPGAPELARAKDAAVGVLCKHGGIMKPFKAAIHAKRLAGEDDSEEVAAFQAQMERLQAMRSDPSTPLPIRNLKTVMTPGASLQGDSDLTRLPWSVGGAVAPHWTDAEIKRRVGVCLGTEDGPGKTWPGVASGGSASAASSAPVEPPVIRALVKSGAKESDAVMRLARSVGSTPYHMLLSQAPNPVDVAALTEIFTYLGLPMADLQPVIERMLVLQLEAQTDYTKAVSSSLSFLTSALP